MARKKKHEEHENHERWLVSYADFITLLFAFFVVMYSLSAVNEGKFRVMAEALKAAFQSKPMSPDPIQFNSFVKPEILGTPELRNLPGVTDGDPQAIALPKTPFPGRRTGGQAESGQVRAMREIAEKVSRAMAPLIEKDLITVKRFRHWLEVEIKSNVLFPSGSAQVQPDAVPVLKRLAGILREYPNRIQVEGYTDNRPIRTAAFPSNWELSTARATSVVHLFSGIGLSPGRLAAVGYGEHRPSAPNATEEGRSKNRKVVLVILAEDGDATHLHDLAAGQEPPLETAAQGCADCGAEGRKTIARTPEPAVPATDPPRAPSVLTPPMEPLEQLLPELKREATATAPSIVKPIGVDGTATLGTVAGTVNDDSRDGGRSGPSWPSRGITPSLEGRGSATPGAAAEKPSIVITKPRNMDVPPVVPMDAKPRRMDAPVAVPMDAKPQPLDRVIALPALPKPGG